MKFYDEYIEQLIQFAEDALYDGDYQEARKLLRKGLMEEPGYPKLHYTLAIMHHYYQVNEALATRHYQLAIHFDPDHGEAYEELTKLCLAKRRHKALNALMLKAEKCEAVEKDFVYITLGKVAEKEGDYNKAIGWYRKALIFCTNNRGTRELRQDIKRTRFKRFKTSWKKWQPQN